MSETVVAARESVDELLWPRNLGNDGPALAMASRVHGAAACAALDGVDFAIEAWWSGDAWEDSPMGQLAAGIWRGYRELSKLVSTWQAAPLQALARLHAVVATDLSPADELGRPRTAEPVDSLRIGAAPSPELVTARLSLLGRMVGEASGVPAAVEAGVVHGEILALRPFTHGSVAVAHLATRLVIASRGLDPDLLVAPEIGVAKLGRPAYVDAIRQYQTGTTAGVAQWLRFIASAIGIGAMASQEILSEIRAETLGKAAEEE